MVGAVSCCAYGSAGSVVIDVRLGQKCILCPPHLSGFPLRGFSGDFQSISYFVYPKMKLFVGQVELCEEMTTIVRHMVYFEF